MSEKSLRAKAIPGLRLGVRSSPALRRPLGTTEMGNRARLTRKEATRCRMPTAWESKKEIPVYNRCCFRGQEGKLRPRPASSTTTAARAIRA